MGKRGRGKPVVSITPLLEFILPVNDDWYPNLPRNTVRIRVYDGERYEKEQLKCWGRISIWGGDDFGMEKDFDFSNLTPTDKEKKIKEMIMEARSFPNPLNKDWLRAKGYVNA